VAVTVDGGSAVLVTIGNDGKVKADFSGMQPVTFAAQIVTTQIRGEVTYKGSTDGMVDLNAPSPTTSSTTALPGSPSASASSATTTTPAGPATAAGKSGGWHPTGKVNVSGLTITVKLTQPVATTVLNDVKVTDVTGTQTTQVAGAVDLQPLLRDGAYRCGGETTLVITTSGTAPALVWSLTRA
jgi:hypothetical protein